MKILFYDTETTGLPKDFNAPVTNIDNWPRLVEIGWIMTDEDGSNPARRNLIAKPDGFTIPEDASDIHGITTQTAMEKGVHVRYILRELESYIKQADMVICHNVAFDEKIIGAEYIRQGMPNPLDGKEKLCTMLASETFCNLPGKWPGKLKWPKLQELHLKLFCVEFDGAHGALADIQATVDCYFELKKQGII